MGFGYLISPVVVVVIYTILTLDWLLFFLRTRRPLYLSRAAVRGCVALVYLYISFVNPSADLVRPVVRILVVLLGFDMLLDFIFVRLMDRLKRFKIFGGSDAG